MSKNLKRISSNIITIIIIIIAVFIYRKFDYNFFSKGITERGKTTFLRDEKIKYSKERSYKIINNDFSDAMFYKKIEVRPNTPYKVTCMIKTENVIGKDSNSMAGAQICLNRTEEHSKVLNGDNDWTKVEFLFNSKQNENIEVGFRLGGNLQNASGTVWFSDLEIEEGLQQDTSNWKFGCFILKNVEANINGKQENYIMTNHEIQTAEINIRKLKNSIKEISGNQMSIEYDVIEIMEPLTTLTYDETNGYYITEKDIYNLIQKYMEENEYDHIFVCTNLPLESQLTKNKNVCEWVGLGNMLYLGKGLSNIRILDNNKLATSSNFSEEVFLHEFLHTLERNSREYGYNIPDLHDYQVYNYKDERDNGLKKWYKAYMNKEIITKEGNYGLPSEIYKLQPAKSENFNYAIKLDRLDQPHNIIEEIKSIIYKISKVFSVKEQKVDEITLGGVSE